ncbi:MAG: hypothetical protein IT405_02920 [Candidatus Yanofskybacteria bacterium]|nr:hypothetical protein [Candidatus Yanofskybacteria bacterium]
MSVSFDVAEVISRGRDANRAQVVVHFSDPTGKKTVGSMTRHVRFQGGAWKGRNTDESCQLYKLAEKVLADMKEEASRLESREKSLTEELKKEKPMAEGMVLAMQLLATQALLAETREAGEIAQAVFNKVAAEHPLEVVFKGM